MQNSLSRLIVFALGLILTTSSYAQFTIDIPGAVSTYVTGINNADHIVGYSVNEEGYTSAFFKLDEEILTLNISGFHTWFGGINNNDMIVGHYSSTGLTNDRHVFIYNPADGTYTDIPDLDGFDFTSANDINDDLWISGDLKNGANRRVFIWNSETGLDVESVFIDGSPAPTYGGHSIDNSGRITGYYIDGANYYSFRYHPDFGYTDSVDLPDPESPATHKTRLMGANNNGLAVLDFILSDNCHIYDFTNPEAWESWEKLVPGSTELHMMDINDSNHIVGYYTDENYVVHGYADMSIGTDFDLQVDGYAFDNESEVLWNYDWSLWPNLYNTDPYWAQYGDYPFPQIYPGYLFQPSSYPGWVDFVSVMSTQSCYFNINFQGIPFDYPVMRPSAFNAWKMHRAVDFEGACFGMAANAGASWQFPDLLNEKFNYGNQEFPLEEIYNWGNNYTVISAANQGMAAQSSQEYTTLNAAVNDQEPHDILNTLLDAFITPNAEVPIVAFDLHLSNGLFGHAVFPYAMIPSNVMNTYYLYIYDPNATGSYAPRFEISFDADYSNYTIEFGTETTPPYIYGMSLMHTQAIYAPQLIAGAISEEELLSTHEEEQETEEERDGEFVRLFCLEAEAFQIDGGGGSVMVDGTNVTNTIPDSKPWLNYGGSPQAISQFLLPTGGYSLVTTEANDDYFTGGMVADETTIIYHRYGTTAGQSDKIDVAGTELSYINQSGLAAELRAEVTTFVDGDEYYFDITSLDLDIDQSISLQNQPDGLFISNDGTSTNYDVKVKIFDDANGYFEATVTQIPIGQGITQVIIPDFSEDGLDGIIITEMDDDPDTEDVVIDFPNEATGLMILSTDTLLLNNDAQLVQFAVGNLGAGVINWQVLSSPSWVELTGDESGANFGVVDLAIASNPDASRSGLLVVQNNGDNSTLNLYINQSDGNVSTGNAPELPSLVLGPNPTPRILTVDLPALLQNKNISYEVRDVQHKVVMSGTCNSDRLTIDFAGQAEGYYLLSIGNDELRLTEKVVKISPIK